jgi:hypothetical protein
LIPVQNRAQLVEMTEFSIVCLELLVKQRRPFSSSWAV